jgi:hypothetical protein
LFVTVLAATGLPKAGRAAEPADPFASPSDAKPPSPTEDEESAVLGAPVQPPPTAESPPAPPRPPAPARRPPAAARRQANDEEASSAAAQAGAADQSALALELSTSGFASGSLAGGLFVGGRTASGLILGGFIDYALTSVSETPAGASMSISTSAQLLRLGVGLRHSFLQSADRLVDLFGAADVSFDHVSADVPSTAGPQPTDSLSASGFSLAAGPGLRLWVHSQIAIGYVARLRVTYLSGAAGALVTLVPTDDASDASKTQIAFDGTFQLLGVF